MEGLNKETAMTILPVARTNPKASYLVRSGKTSSTDSQGLCNRTTAEHEPQGCQ